jgi:hypothetical protein
MAVRELAKRIVRRSPLYWPLRNWLNKLRQARELTEWEGKGRSGFPPHIIKQRTLREYSERYGLKVLVETGTYYGDMVEAMKCIFDHIYSIELGDDLYRRAKERFKRQKHVEIIHGDSGKELGNVMSKIHQPALFWLDGHYSAGNTAKGDKETPIYEELQYILNARDRGHVIVIDDARCFGTDPAYPSMEALNEVIRSKRMDVDILVKDDSIRITGKQDG